MKTRQNSLNLHRFWQRHLWLSVPRSTPHHEKWFDISLAQWSLHGAFRGSEKDAMDFARIAKRDFGIAVIEYVNQFYMENFTPKVVSELKKRSKGEGVDNVLIMCDRLGRLGDPEKAARRLWITTSMGRCNKELDCHSIRVNASSTGTYAEQMKLAANGLSRLGDYGDSIGINVIVENRWTVEPQRLVGRCNELANRRA